MLVIAAEVAPTSFVVHSVLILLAILGEMPVLLTNEALDERKTLYAIGFGTRVDLVLSAPALVANSHLDRLFLLAVFYLVAVFLAQ